MGYSNSILLSQVDSNLYRIARKGKINILCQFCTMDWLLIPRVQGRGYKKILGGLSELELLSNQFERKCCNTKVALPLSKCYEPNDFQIYAINREAFLSYKGITFFERHMGSGSSATESFAHIKNSLCKSRKTLLLSLIFILRRKLWPQPPIHFSRIWKIQSFDLESENLIVSESSHTISK